MKRCTSLTALLVGLSLTTASVALAASPDSKPNKPVRVAQADPAPSQPSGPTDPAPAPTEPAPATPAPTEPAPAAAPTAEPSSSPVVVLGTGTSTPGSDTPQSSAAEPSAKPKPRPWAGTSLFGQTSMSTSTVFQGQQQYNDPTVDSSIYFLPRYALSDAWQLRGRLIFTYEWTNSDETVTRNEPRFGDAAVQLFYRKIPAIATIKPLVGLSLSVPTSPESRARTLVVNPGLIAQFARPFEHVLGGDLLLLGTLSYSHPFYRNQTPEIRGDFPYQRACLGGATCGDQLGGAFNTSDSFSYSLLVAPSWGKWSPALYYMGATQWVYTGSTVINPLDGKAIEPTDGFSPSRTRQSHYFSAWLDYEINTWLTGEVGYFMSRSALNENGKYANPFFDRYQDMRVYLGANISVDNLIQEITGKGEGEGGIVRAQNNHSSMWNF